MQCPHCKTPELKPTKLDEGLPVQSCPDCEGTIISLLHYRDWVERNPGIFDEVGTTNRDCIIETDDSKTVLKCPKCRRLMSKFNIAGDTQNKLDLCTSCDEVWLDKGEWELLESLHLADTIPSVFTEAWQRRVKQEISEQKRQTKLVKQIGETDAEKCRDIKAWLDSHKNRPEILFYLNQKK